MHSRAKIHSYRVGALYYYMIWSPVFALWLYIFFSNTHHSVSSNPKHIELQPQESINILFHFTANLSQTLWLHFYFIQKTKEDWTCEDKRKGFKVNRFGRNEIWTLIERYKYLLCVLLFKSVHIFSGHLFFK